MPKITLQNGNIATFQGDAIICPSDVDLSFRKANKWVTEIFEEAGFTELSKELAVIGSCDIGNAVITKGYKLKAKHLIFLPYTNYDDIGNTTDYVLFHQSLRSAFTLAKIYNLERVAIPLLEIRSRMNFFERILHEALDKKIKKLKSEEVMNIIIGVSNEFNDLLKEVVIYR